jgi:threonine dehydrogenase-like Zn-dependent dehydrogenase
MVDATAFWVAAAGEGSLRRETLRSLGEGDVLVEALASGVSRGTETLVFHGRVPESQHQRMRAPYQAGDFTFPVKYGYCSVGRVIQGSAELEGRRVFCLHPHQDRYVVPQTAVVPIPDGLPTMRAVLAANMETALNGLWDATPRLGDRIAVVGGGVVGLLVAGLAGQIPGCSVQLIDTNPAKAESAKAFGLHFAAIDEAIGDADLVIHASGHPSGLCDALTLGRFEATILELSWFGDREVTLPLGEAFHSRRLRLISSQVGAVAPGMRDRRGHRERMALALDLLAADGRFDRLLAPPVAFDRLPEVMTELLGPRSDVLCQVIDYSL